ncbi:MAG: YdcF family protein [Emcibacter sp.]|nr:YdcF family protein [Emcibacter sp.]
MFLQPSNLIFIFMFISLLLLWKNYRRAGLSLLSFCLTLYFLTMTGPLTNWLMVPLEERFSIYTNDVSHGPYSGIIVLAGAERLHMSTRHNQVTLSGAAERLIEAAKLARQFPELPIIYCGGGRSEGMLTEVQVAQKFFTEAGIDLSRIRFDHRSYNTYTNAIEAKALIKPDETATWLLVTSAFHMPRAVGSYRTAGLNIQPYPVDYRTNLSASRINIPSAGTNFSELDYAAHEWVGLLTYYISGHNDVLFPAP